MVGPAGVWSVGDAVGTDMAGSTVSLVDLADRTAYVRRAVWPSNALSVQRRRHLQSATPPAGSSALEQMTAPASPPPKSARITFALTRVGYTSHELVGADLKLNSGELFSLACERLREQRKLIGAVACERAPGVAKHRLTARANVALVGGAPIDISAAVPPQSTSETSTPKLDFAAAKASADCEMYNDSSAVPICICTCMYISIEPCIS